MLNTQNKESAAGLIGIKNDAAIRRHCTTKIINDKRTFPVFTANILLIAKAKKVENTEMSVLIDVFKVTIKRRLRCINRMFPRIMNFEIHILTGCRSKSL